MGPGGRWRERIDWPWDTTSGHGFDTDGAEESEFCLEDIEIMLLSIGRATWLPFAALLSLGP